MEPELNAWSIDKAKLNSLARADSKLRSLLVTANCPAVKIIDQSTGSTHGYILLADVWHRFGDKNDFVENTLTATDFLHETPDYQALLLPLPASKVVLMGKPDPICAIVSARASENLIDFIRLETEQFNARQLALGDDAFKLRHPASIAKDRTNQTPSTESLSTTQPPSVALKNAITSNPSSSGNHLNGIHLNGRIKSVEYYPFIPGLHDIRDAARTRASIFITGETGSGKELLARYIHHESSRRKMPFFAVNCAALVDGLFEAELFGHEKGAYTGADKQRRGLLEQANGGTLFLDELAELQPDKQVKLLRFLQEGEVTPVGSRDTKPVDVRIIAATNHNVEGSRKSGKLREDLYHRVATVEFEIPPLRDQKLHLRALAEFLIPSIAKDLSEPGYVVKEKRISTQAINRMMAYHWPGNVRELRNVLAMALIRRSNSFTITQENINLPVTPRADLPHTKPKLRPTLEILPPADGANYEPKDVDDLIGQLVARAYSDHKRNLRITFNDAVEIAAYKIYERDANTSATLQRVMATTPERLMDMRGKAEFPPLEDEISMRAEDVAQMAMSANVENLEAIFDRVAATKLQDLGLNGMAMSTVMGISRSTLTNIRKAHGITTFGVD